MIVIFILGLLYENSKMIFCSVVRIHGYHSICKYLVNYNKSHYVNST